MIANINSKYEYRNTKWFDQPFDRLTVLSEVEGLTTLSQVEGQIRIPNDKNSPIKRFWALNTNNLTGCGEFPA